ncbi:hypothetical protein Pan14r_12260 [Crateriforma conspicua]|uniref:Uncharacterized protein n=1 Tax=Crateriforma conspicua TaxID=2527996 RepID=A0A5C5Y652_9PLAN|nr:hypothetical protein Mal65_26990 [Crateriforma conspicua]TWT68942.1 hypothetical protein Pan14r_12260 [Crateriforma conspicua]
MLQPVGKPINAVTDGCDGGDVFGIGPRIASSSYTSRNALHDVVGTTPDVTKFFKTSRSRCCRTPNLPPNQDRMEI